VRSSTAGCNEDARIDAMATVLALRRQTLEMVARRILAALDRHHVVQVRGLPDVAEAASPDPVDPGDERIAIVEQALRRCLYER
jgi:hypothetical protein